MKGKNSSKIIVPILMASMAGTILSANVRDMQVYAATDNNLIGATISVTGFKSKGKVGDEYKLPDVIVSSGFEKVMELVDPRGAILKNVESVFTPAYSGTYTLKYKALAKRARTVKNKKPHESNK